MTKAWALSIALGGAIALSSVAASADDDRARAEALFREGRRAMDAQDFVIAKERLEASNRLMPGPGTLISLGYCYERLGLPANAYVAYRAAAALASKAKRADRLRAANERLAVLDKTVALVSLVLSEPGNVVTVDGKVVDPKEKVPVEEGRHLVRVSAPGRASWQNELRVEKGERIRIAVPVLAVETSEPPPKSASRPVPVPVPVPDPPPRAVASAAPAPAPAPSASPPASSSSSTSLPSRKTIGLVVGGVGIASLGVGAFLGLSAASTYDKTNAHCNDSVCDAEGVDLTKSARTSATWSTIAMIGGAAAVGAGAVLFFTAPRSSSQTTTAAARVSVHSRGDGIGIVWEKPLQ